MLHALAAVFLAGLLGSQDGTRAEDLRRILQDPTADQRDRAIYAVGDLGPEAAPLIPLLVQVLEQVGRLDYCTLDGARLGASGLDDGGADAPKYEKPEDRAARLARREAVSAYRALRKLGDPAVGPLLEALAGLDLGDGGYRVAEVALVSCCRTAPEPPWADLERAVQSPSPVTRGAAALALSGVREPDRAAPLLLSLCTDEEPHVRWRAVEALAELEARDDAVRQALVERLFDPTLRVQVHAARALSSWVPREDGVDEVLELALTAGEAVPCALALYTLSTSATVSGTELKAIRKAFTHESGLVRMHAIFAMRRLDPDHRDLRIWLKRLKDDPDPRVARAASSALRQP